MYRPRTTFVQQVASIHSDANVRQECTKRDLACQLIQWEDSGRAFMSSVGPNISDLTLTVVDEEARSDEPVNMPCIRKSNFADVTADLPIDDFNVTVGNEAKETGTDGKRATTRIKFEDWLKNAGKYTGNDKVGNLWLERDKKILTSAQFCVLPLRGTEQGDKMEDAKATWQADRVKFAPRLFSYQSETEDPAVLVVMVTAAGTSAQVVTGEWPGQKLFFNVGGQAAYLFAKRLEDDRRERGVKDLTAKMDMDEKEKNTIIIFQIPLKQQPKRGFGFSAAGESALGFGPAKKYGMPLASFSFGGGGTGALPSLGVAKAACFAASSVDESMLEGDEDEAFEKSVTRGIESKKRGIDHALLGVCEPHGKFDGTKNLKLERDPRFPIRATIQFYQATDSATIDAERIQMMADKILAVYKRAGDAVGSLVSGSAGFSSTAAPAASAADAPKRATAPDPSVVTPSLDDRLARPMVFGDD